MVHVARLRAVLFHEVPSREAHFSSVTIGLIRTLLFKTKFGAVAGLCDHSVKAF